MIRIILRGRTGNILFQYALGRALAAKHGVPLMMDASWYNTEGWREVSHLLNLPLRAKVVRRFSTAARALRKLTKKHYWEYRGLTLLKEKDDDQSFDPCFLEAPAECVIHGYFQSPRYFESVAGELRFDINSLLARDAFTDSGASLAGGLAAENSVAVHVRRGDYLRMPLFNVCDETYHRHAMNRMRSLVADARFFIFSDDAAWCRGAFTESDCEVIDSGTAATNPLHDLHLMSLAGHHIIANSSYSWWAAWLGDKPGQQVIMPDRWFNDGVNAPVEEKRLPHWTILD
jgi:hypothetical protein